MASISGGALVTGAATRLGRSIALALASEGHDVAIHYASSQAQALSCAEEARALGVKAVTLQADLLDREAVAGLVPRALEALGGPLGVLVNNASIFENDSFDANDEALWDMHFDVQTQNAERNESKASDLTVEHINKCVHPGPFDWTQSFAF